MYLSEHGGGTTVCTGWKTPATAASSTAVLVEARQNRASSVDWFPESTVSLAAASFKPA